MGGDTFRDIVTPHRVVSGKGGSTQAAPAAPPTPDNRRYIDTEAEAEAATVQDEEAEKRRKAIRSQAGKQQATAMTTPLGKIGKMGGTYGGR